MAKAEFLNKQTQTKSGIQCQRWDSQIPHEHEYKLVGPLSDLGSAGAFCRSPEQTGYSYPWCFTTDPKKRWEYCAADTLPQGRLLPHHTAWTPSPYKDRLSQVWGIPMLYKRLSRDRLVFNMEIPILVRRHLYIATAPWFPIKTSSGCLNIEISSYQYRESNYKDKIVLSS